MKKPRLALPFLIVLACLAGPAASAQAALIHSFDSYLGGGSLSDPEALADILTATVAVHERSLPNPWSVDPGTEFFQTLVRAVVGFRIEIDRREGKWKLNHNQPL